MRPFTLTFTSLLVFLFSLELVHAAPLSPPSLSEIGEELARAQRPVPITEQGFGDKIRDIRAVFLKSDLSDRLLRTITRGSTAGTSRNAVQAPVGRLPPAEEHEKES